MYACYALNIKSPGSRKVQFFGSLCTQFAQFVDWANFTTFFFYPFHKLGNYLSTQFYVWSILKTLSWYIIVNMQMKIIINMCKNVVLIFFRYLIRVTSNTGKYLFYEISIVLQNFNFIRVTWHVSRVSIFV